MGAGRCVAIQDSGVFLARGTHARRSVCIRGGCGGPDTFAGSVGGLDHDSAFALCSNDDFAIGGEPSSPPDLSRNHDPTFFSQSGTVCH